MKKKLILRKKRREGKQVEAEIRLGRNTKINKSKSLFFLQGRKDTKNTKF